MYVGLERSEYHGSKFQGRNQGEAIPTREVSILSYKNVISTGHTL